MNKMVGAGSPSQALRAFMISCHEVFSSWHDKLLILNMGWGGALFCVQLAFRKYGMVNQNECMELPRNICYTSVLFLSS